MPLPSHLRLRAKLRDLVPTSIVGRLALYIGVLRLGTSIAQMALTYLGNRGAAVSLSGWANGLSWVLGMLLAILALRWVRREFMWKLRNRLIVTYVFIGVIPVLATIVAMSIGAALFANQYAASQARAELEAEMRALDVFNQGLAAQVDELFARRQGSSVRGVLAVQARHIGGRFPGVELHAWRAGAAADTHSSHQPKDLPDWAKAGFSGITQDEGKLYLRSVRKHGDLVTLASAPVTRDLLDRTVSGIGQISFYLARRARRPSQAFRAAVPGPDQRGQIEDVDYELTHADVVGGKVPAAAGKWDAERDFGTVSPNRDWATGNDEVALIQLRSRPSVLLNRLFSSRGEFAASALALLAVVAAFFVLIELIAVVVGVRLTRTITLSVYRLYQATQRINRGDLKHRIEVKANDQLAHLQRSFNSMTGSLERLIEEQKEKERLENELAIAQEVQATLFPKEICDLTSLELHGVCRPARTVSGDYYDFLPFNQDPNHERLGVAVGDISGKGISAALLMATLHSAVRAYEFGRLPSREQFVRAGAAAIAGVSRMVSPSRELMVHEGVSSPAEVLGLLNRHLYHSTQPEKYATLFLGIFDGAARTIAYSNAGHLPPMIIGVDNSIRRLETGGTVIGLFDGVTYEESRVQLQPGDVFVAFSDGVTEPENEFGEFGEERLIELVLANRNLSLARISEIVLAAVQDWIGSAEQPDDVTLVLARAR